MDCLLSGYHKTTGGGGGGGGEGLSYLHVAVDVCIGNTDLWGV